MYYEVNYVNGNLLKIWFEKAILLIKNYNVLFSIDNMRKLIMCIKSAAVLPPW